MKFSDTYFLNDILTDDRVGINLLLTKFCNFSCERCFFWSSPQQPTKYMGNDVLEAIDRNTVILDYFYEELDYSNLLHFNAIGGEPLTNLKKFEAIIDQWFVGYWLDKYEFEMTTNGYWLEFPNLIPKVINILEKLQDNYAYYDQDFVRISTSAWHDKFYKRLPEGMNGYTYLNRIIDSITEMRLCTCGEEIYYRDSSENYCTKCGNSTNEENYCYYCEEIVEVEDGVDDDWCPNCELSYEYIEWPSNVIYVESYSKNFVPTGGGQNVIGHKKYDHTCYKGTQHNILSFDPDGNVVDGCCSGGGLLHGNIKTTSIMHLFVLQKLFFDEQDVVKCSTCNRKSNEFVEKYGQQIQEFCSSPLTILHEEHKIVIQPDGSFEVFEIDLFEAEDISKIVLSEIALSEMPDVVTEYISLSQPLELNF